nr:hypothetical protein [Tanacetum cinerariifolium]
MAYFVTILTPDNARSCVMQCTLPTQGMGSIISMVSISPEGFMPSILLLVVVIVTVVIVVVILVVVVVAIDGVFIVVMIIRVEFWCTASARTLDNGEIELNATVDGQVKTITEAFVKRHLKLANANGISTLPTTENFKQLALMGYVTDSDKLTFQKGHFSP